MEQNPNGGWATAQSPILVTTITLERLRKRGYEALLTYYEKIAPHLNEPLYTRTVHNYVSNCGVRGALRQLTTGGAVYSIPEPSTLEDRSLIRLRATLVKDMVRFKQRIKSFLHFYGISIPAEFEKSGTHWSKRFMKWLNQVSLDHESGTQTLKILVQEAEQQRKLLLEVLRKIRVLSRSERYATNMELLQTIPGVGFITAITFLTEIENIERFENTDHFAGFVGLIPNRHSSGNKENNGDMTFRGQTALRKSLIESSWFAARLDPALAMSFNIYVRRMEPNKAIIRIARKVLNRMYYVLKTKREYVSGVVK